MNQIDLSVIIVNYNGLKYFKECLDSLYDKLQGLSFEIIVIDNNSPDDSCNYIKQYYSGVILIESKINYGFGKGNNEAVKQAKGEYLLLINNDTIVLDNLVPVFNIVKKDSSIGAAGIKMLDGNKNYLTSVGKFPSFSSMLRIKNMGEMGEEFRTGNFSKDIYEVDWVTGSLILMPKRVYEEIGGFDEDYFMYVEDVDFGKKIEQKGYRRIFLPNYNYIHFVGFNKSRNPLLIQGYKIYLSKHTKGLNKLLLLSALKVNAIVKMVKKLINIE